MRSKEKPLPCPLCGTNASVSKYGHGRGNVGYNVSCGVKPDDSDTCGLVLFSDGPGPRHLMVEKWNTRETDKPKGE